MYKWTYIESSDLKAIAVLNSDLVIQFKNNTTYKYLKASIEFNNLLNSGSKGKYFYSNIKNKYSFLKVVDNND